MPEPGLRWADQKHVAPDAIINIDEQPPSALWKTVATTAPFQTTLASAVRQVVDDGDHTRAPSMILYDAGVTAVDGGYARLAADCSLPAEADPHQRALDLTAQIGQDGMSVLGHIPLTEIVDGPLACFQAAETVPGISVDCSDAFRDRPPKERRAVLSLLGMLATACDVRLHCSRLVARWLLVEHELDLPTSFSESVNARHSGEQPVEETVRVAEQALDVDGRGVQTLRRLAEELGETLPLTAVRSIQSVSDSRVSQVLGELEQLGLIGRHQTGDEKLVSLREPGTALLDALDDKYGTQATLDGAFSDRRQSPSQAVSSPAQEGIPRPGEGPAGAGAGDSDSSVPYRTRFLNPSSGHHPAAAAALDGGITTIDTTSLSEMDKEHRRTRFVSYDEDREEVVVAVHALTPLQYITSTALGLASPRLLDRVLTPGRLDEMDSSLEILRCARCIGAFPDEAADDPEALRDNLVSWGEDIATMTRKLEHGDYDDRNRFRGEIMRSAHGLAGTIVHLLDVLDTDITREIRIPRSLSDQRLSAMARTISLSATIQSTYGHFAVYRQLLEDREQLREMAMEPTVDAADPFAELIGGFVVRGPASTRLGRHIDGMLAGENTHPDAPEIALSVPINSPSREQYAETAARMCTDNNLQVTREAVTVCQALTQDPYTTALALDHLSPEDGRELRIDEVRTALGSLAAPSILPDAPTGVSQIVATLLGTHEPLSQTALANRAGVSARTIQRHEPALTGTGLVERTDAGYRIALSAATTDERGTKRVPAPVGDDLSQPVDLLFEIVLVETDDTSWVGDPDSPLSEEFCWPPNYDVLARYMPHFDIWIRLARDLCETPESDPPVATLDARPPERQTSLLPPQQSVRAD